MVLYSRVNCILLAIVVYLYGWCFSYYIPACWQLDLPSWSSSLMMTIQGCDYHQFIPGLKEVSRRQYKARVLFQLVEGNGRLLVVSSMVRFARAMLRGH